MQSREDQVAQLAGKTFDVLVIGGGINGAATAAALSAHGLSVAIVDARDFAGFTSQSSSGLIWGGIKYLETQEFLLVRRLCRQRNELIRAYPSSIRETRFLASLYRTGRLSRWVLWLGAWLYWLLGSGATAPPRFFSARQIAKVEPALSASSFVGGVEYSDAILADGDARFIFNLLDTATDRGCVAVNYLEVVKLQFHANNNNWEVRLDDIAAGGEYTLNARILVNAAGPFVDDINRMAGVTTRHRHVFSKGIHLVVPRLSHSGRALAFFADDGRPFFVIPTRDRSSIGTTDTKVDWPISEVTEKDRQFVLDNINHALSGSDLLTRKDIIAERCGVRPLAVERKVDQTMDFLKLSRRYVVEVDHHRMVSIFGGKLTDFLSVGREITKKVLVLCDRSPVLKSDWFGEAGSEERNIFLHRAAGVFEIGDPGFAIAERLWRYYGNQASNILDAVESDASLGKFVLQGFGITRAELEFVRTTQMVVSLDDYLRRRTLLAQTVPEEELANLSGMMEVCRILFGKNAEACLEEYFGDFRNREL